MKECFVERKFRKASLDRISQINEIIDENQKLGYKITLRELYYQLVSKNLIPNKVSEYKKLEQLLCDARKAGLTDWDAIEDRTRSLQGINHYYSPHDAINAIANKYHTDLWDGQPNRVEVWVEKDALSEKVGRICNKYDVRYFVCRGYTSVTEMHEAGQRLKWYLDNGQQPIILHLGDHDPSGIDISRDILKRVELFGRMSGKIDFHRIALNMDQIERFNPPPNPVKETDTRYKSYIDKFGETSWELDALGPKVIPDLIEENILKILDVNMFNERKRQMKEERDFLLKAANQWSNITQYLR